MTHTVALDEAAVAAFAEKVGVDQAVAQGAALAHVGDRLGLWARLAESGPVTPGELAGATGLAERYLREWLATQAAAGYLRHDAATGRFTLPPEHAAVLADDDSPAALAGGFALTAAVWSAADRLVEAFRTGQGIGWGEQDSRLFDAVERTFRPLYRASLVDEWLPALDGVVARLEAGGRVLDVGCGLGTSSLIMAGAFPRATVAGIDLHAPSITAARAAAARAGCADRVTFDVRGATGYPADGYDLICFFDALHDMGDPAAAAAHARRAVADDGTVLVVEPAAGDTVAENLNPVGLSYYAASTAFCVPGSLAQDGGAALGAQAGEARLHALLTAAGFGRVRTAARTDYNLVIEARP